MTLSVIIVAVVAGVLFFGKAGTALADQLYIPSNLIGDPQFTDSHSMSVADIQYFLNIENSGIRNLTDTEACSPPTPVSPDPWASAYYPHCGQTISVAQIIYDAAQAYDISPRVILATMQKEQSLVTNPNPTQSAINTAMGYGCPSSCNPAYQGFFNQVDMATWQFRTYIMFMNNAGWWGVTSSFSSHYPCANAHPGTYSAGLYPGNTVTFSNPGGTPVTITLANSATAALYCYTPFVGPYSQTGYSGSYNFVQSYESWWGSTIGTLLTAPGSGVYVLYNNAKQPFPSQLVFNSYSYSWVSVTTISSSALSQIPDGPAMPYNVHYRDGQLVSAAGGVYAVSTGLKQAFPNELTFFTNGYKYSDSVAISPAELALIPDGPAMSYNVHYRDGKLVTTPGGGVYLVSNGSKRPFPDQLTFFSNNYSYGNAYLLSSSEVSLIPDGPALSYNVHYRDGKLVTANGNGIYLVSNGQKRAFPDYATFSRDGYSSSSVMTLSATEVSLIPDGAPMN